MTEVLQRPVRQQDSLGLQRLLADCYAPYPHCFLDAELEDPGLLTPVESFPTMQVLELEAEVVGCITWSPVPDDGDAIELKKLYVSSRLRGQGWGRRLIEWVEQQAKKQGARRVVLWTDTKFETAHRVYERLGYQATGEQRPLNDISETWEYFYSKELAA